MSPQKPPNPSGTPAQAQYSLASAKGYLEVHTTVQLQLHSQLSTHFHAYVHTTQIDNSERENNQ